MAVRPRLMQTSRTSAGAFALANGGLSSRVTTYRRVVAVLRSWSLGVLRVSSERWPGSAITTSRAAPRAGGTDLGPSETAEFADPCVVPRPARETRCSALGREVPDSTPALRACVVWRRGAPRGQAYS